MKVHTAIKAGQVLDQAGGFLASSFEKLKALVTDPKFWTWPF